jgi:hypothetical protein
MVFLWFDDSLTPLSKEILEYEIKHQPDDNGEVYIWCLECKTSDVYASGVEIVKRINDIMSSGENTYDEINDNYEFHQFYNSDMLCEKFENDCNVFDIIDTADIQQLTSKNNWAISRYLTYLNHNHFSSQIFPDYDEPYPSYRNLITAQRVYHLSLLDSLDKKNIAQIVSELTEELILTKNVLGESESLYHRMISVVLVSENVEFVNQLYQKGYMHKLDLTKYVSELFISKTHHDLARGFKRDHVIWVDVIRTKHEITDALKKKKASFLTKFYTKFLYKLAYKENMTINYVTEDLVAPLKLTTLKANEFFKEAQNMPKKERMNKFRNYLGRKAFNKHVPFTLHEYIARIHSLHNKMNLLKSLFHFGSIEAMKQTTESTEFPHKNLFNDELPYFEENNYCFSTLEGIRTRPKDLCLRVLPSNTVSELSIEFNAEL